MGPSGPREENEQPEQSGEHLVESCSLLAEIRKSVEREEMHEWKTRHTRNQLIKKKKGPVEPEKEKEEEKDRLELFFCQLYEFHNPVQNAPVFVPAELPPRYAIDFVPATVPAVPAVISSSPALPVFPVNAAVASVTFFFYCSVRLLRCFLSQLRHCSYLLYWKPIATSYD